ncbi:MAG TPA: VOC family protein [Miltoncostaeaceae bacterium]|jgi:methylmalonyl-CoA/ethylmalonyl-CoA epimerase|nr:VOC family protein [Miltoncostaeaceae bacterium]
MALVRDIDHVAVAVESIEDALALYSDVLGGSFVSGGDDDASGVRAVRVQLPGLRVELLQPLRPDTVLQAYIDRHGQGLHHVTMLVPDLDEAIATLEAAGFETTGTDRSRTWWMETYIRPRSGFGALIQLVETAERWDRPVEGLTLDDVLAGRAIWADGRARLREEAG